MNVENLQAIQVQSADDAYNKIHTALAIWIHYALDEGFMDDPLMGNHVTDLIRMADIMKSLEGRIDRAASLNTETE